MKPYTIRKGGWKGSLICCSQALNFFSKEIKLPFFFLKKKFEFSQTPWLALSIEHGLNVFTVLVVTFRRLLK